MVVSCEICGKQFDSFRGLNGHRNAHIKRAETFEAPKTKKGFNWFDWEEKTAEHPRETLKKSVKKAKQDGWKQVSWTQQGGKREKQIWGKMAQSPQWNAWVKDFTARCKYERNIMSETYMVFNGKAYWKDTYEPDHMGEEGGWSVLTKDNKVLLFYYYDDWENTTTVMRKTFTVPTKTKAKPKAKAKKKTTRKAPAKKKTGRKAPTISATRRKIGTRMRGNDGNMWQVKKSGKSQRWMAGAEDFEAEEFTDKVKSVMWQVRAGTHRAAIADWTDEQIMLSALDCLAANDQFSAEDYNSFTDEIEKLIKKYGELLSYDTEFHSTERGGDGIMHISTSFRPHDPYFDQVDLDAEYINYKYHNITSDEKCDLNYHLRCRECRLCFDCNPQSDSGDIVCISCSEESIAAENWGGDPKGQLAKALQKARATLKKPLNITKLPHPDQKDLIDFEADEWKLLPRDPLGRWQKPVRSESINQLRESLQTSVPAISELLDMYGGDNPNNRYKLYNDLQSLKIDAMDAALPDDTNMTLDNLDLSWRTPQEYYEYILEEPINVPDDTEDDSTTFEFQERLVRYTAMTMLPQEVEHLIKENAAEITGDLFADTQEAESEINFLNAVRRYQKLSEQWSAE